MLELHNINHTFTTGSGQHVEALREVNLEIPDGQIISLVGPSGCGKSTLLRIAAGFLAPTSGTVTSGGERVTGPGLDRGMVFQQPTLFPWLDVRKNVLLAHEFTGSAQAAAEAESLLSLVGLEDAADRYPFELSGGMQQRVQIARVLAPSPQTVLMDEPFGALDPFTREQLQAELIRVWHEHQPTIVFVTHSVEEALLVGDRVVVMAPNPGRVIQDVPVPDDLRSTRLVGRASSERDQLRAHLREAAADARLVELRQELTESIANAREG